MKTVESVRRLIVPVGHVLCYPLWLVTEVNSEEVGYPKYQTYFYHPVQAE